VIALIYEAFRSWERLRQAMYKTGNSLILGSEASHSNGVIALALQSALEETGMPVDAWKSWQRSRVL